MESGGIQSIEVGMRLMRAFLDAGGPVTLKALADGAGFAPPKAHRYLVSLVRSGLVEREAQTGRYSIGPLAIELGFAALGKLDREGLGRTAISELSEATGQTCCLSVWTGEAVIVCAVATGVDVIYTGVRTGTRASFLRAASGRMFLACLPVEATRDALKDELRRDSFQANELPRILEQIRRDGMAISRDGMTVGLSAISAPVWDHSGRIIYTITVLGPSATLDARPDGPLAKATLEAATQLSKKLGYRGKIPSRAAMQPDPPPVQPSRGARGQHLQKVKRRGE